MRRPPSLRSIVDRRFRSLESLAKTLADNIPQDSSMSLELLLEQINELHDFALSVTAEQPALDTVKFMLFLNRSEPDQVRGFVRKNLEREVPLARFEGHDTSEICDRIMESLCSLHRHLPRDAAIRAGSEAVVAALPRLKAPEFSRHMIETLMRESLGMDGRAPEPDQDSRYASNNERMILEKIADEPLSEPTF